jgi:hypothetical protein
MSDTPPAAAPDAWRAESRDGSWQGTAGSRQTPLMRNTQGVPECGMRNDMSESLRRTRFLRATNRLDDPGDSTAECDAGGAPRVRGAESIRGSSP